MVAVINSSQIKNPTEHKTKLLKRASRTFLISSTIIMILSGFALYFYTKALLQNEIEEELYSDMDRVERLLEEDPDIRGIPPIITVAQSTVTQQAVLSDTLIYDPLQDEIELFRQLSRTKRIDGREYLITVRAMTIESEDILFAIMFTFLVIIIIAFVFLFFVNNSRNQKLWEPFFDSLEKLKTFSLKSNKDLQLQSSNIVEFDELNREILALTTKVRADYRNLKQFTEDVSHEMQTPLAIMLARIDTLINEQDITQGHFEQLSLLQADIQRLKKLNKKLILLAKIDNEQFTANDLVSINEVVRQTVLNMHELTPVEITVSDNGVINTTMDLSLASVLCTNLLSNAVKHNQDVYPIRVNLEERYLQVINVGKVALGHPDQIFDRFYKESKRQDSTGLGLSIVKKICDYYSFVPSYRFRENEHIFQIDFIQSPSSI